MSNRYPGGIITKNPATPTGPFETGSAPGIWTLEQQMQFKQQGVWPLAGNTVNYIEDVFSTFLYAGNSGTQSIVNGIDLSTKGGLVWVKNRGVVVNHQLSDTVNGMTFTSAKYLRSNLDSAISDNGPDFQRADSVGFTWGTDSASSGFNLTGNNYVSWTFREQPKFFDIVTYTGTGSNTTIAHSLGAVPGSIIVKRTNSPADWAVYHRSLANTQYLVLNSTAAVATGATWWNSTTPTSAVFSVGTDASVNASGGTYVAYVFAHDAGGFGLTGTDNVISCGSYATDASYVGPNVNLGYEPQWILVKNSTANGAWYIIDNMRGWESGGNVTLLNPDTSSAESTTTQFKLNATGFQDNGAFAASATMIYIAIRRGPMKTPTVGTSVFSPLAISNSVNTKNTTNFPIDMQWWRYRDIPSANVIDSDRLRGISTDSTSSGQFLRTPSSTSESTGSNTRGWDNTGFLTPVSYADTSTVLWNWRRAPGYFDTVCYTGTGVAGRTVTHNLTVTPELIIVKKRSDTEFWGTLFVATSSTGALNSTANLSTSNNQYYFGNDVTYTAPTSSVFTVGSVDRVNTSGGTYVAYLFATCAGVSKVGSYTGTGALQTVNCGFTTGSRFVLIKRTDSTGNWYVWDSARGITAGNDPYILVNTDAGSEVAGTNYVDTDTTGFKVTAAAPAEINASAGSYIFLAIA